MNQPLGPRPAGAFPAKIDAFRCTLTGGVRLQAGDREFLLTPEQAIEFARMLTNAAGLPAGFDLSKVN